MPRRIEGDWHPGSIPDNVRLHETAYVESAVSFEPFRSELPDAVDLGEGAAVYCGSQLDAGPRGRISIGRCVILNGCLIIADELVEIGDYALVAWLVVIMDNERSARDIHARRALLREAAAHPERRLTRVGPGPARPVRIGRAAWIGFETCILPGVTIGEGSIVGARSVVIDDIPPWSIAAGNPARIIRSIEPGAPQHA
ncbi:MAG: acyltransferase [Phycisphaerales bacterium]